MTALSIYGIPVPVERGSLKRDIQEIGERGVSFNGTPWSSIRAIRRNNFSFRTTPMLVSEANFWRALIQGDGATWGFDSGPSSDQGHPIAVVGYEDDPPAVISSGGVSGSCLSSLKSSPSSASGYLEWAIPSGIDGWTFECWYSTNLGVTWNHFWTNSEELYNENVWINGSVTGFDNVPFGIGVYPNSLGTTGRTIRLYHDRSWCNTLRFDDMMFVSGIAPSSYVSSIYTAELWRKNHQSPAALYRKLPELHVTGDVVLPSQTAGLAPCVCVGRVSGGPSFQEYQNGELKIYEQLEVELIEKVKVG